MKKTILVSTLVVICSALSTNAQLRVAIVGGGQQSSVIETNNLVGWDSIKNNYSERTGGHFGFIADLPLGAKSNISFQPGVIYYNKGRKYSEQFDTTISQMISTNSTQYINYIDIPLNLVLKFGKKTKFVLGGGPYLSFFYTGVETRETFSKGDVFTSEKNEDVPVGNKPGTYQTINYGVNGLAGFEFGRVILTANYSRGLNNFYQSPNYSGSFRHQVIGATLGIYLGRPAGVESRVSDKDHDGIPDNKDNCPSKPGTALTNGCPDKDGDGIADQEDKCPNEAGLAKNNGCPTRDRDNDGVVDKDDKCPEIPGLVRYHGCPVPDADKDGINDEQDKCPTVSGVARYYGCPVPDTDSDGVNDEEDKCPTEKGTEENNGCPAKAIKKEIIEKVSFAARRIQFGYSSVDLMPASFKVLDEVVKILKENPTLKISVEGHTSNDGIPAANLKLSQERADNVKNYLESKGIDARRLKAKGYGNTQPLNNGATEEEKSQNRRVELKLSN